MHREFWWKNLKESSCLEDPYVGGKICNKMDYTEVEWEGMDWGNSGQAKNQWPAFVNTVMKLQVLQKKQQFLD